MQKILMLGGTEISPQPPGIFQRTKVNVLTSSSITNQGPQIAGLPTVNNGIKVAIRIDLLKSWQLDYKLLKLLPVGSYFPLVDRHTTTNYKADMGNYVQTMTINEWTINACRNTLYSFSIQRRHTVWDKKTRKRRQNVPVITYNTALLFPHTKKVNENTRNFKPVIISCHRPGDPFTHLLFIQIKEIIQGADWQNP